MPGESFRFIHASDFHLERPLGDLDELPKHLQDAIAEAPWKAAESVFEAALIENVDFVLLAGDLLAPQAAGPRGMSMLVDAFDALAERDIKVLWASGQVDAAQFWPESIPLPSNVVRLPKSRAETVPITRSGRTIAVVVGRSGESMAPIHVPSYRIDPTGEFTIGLGYGTAEPAALSESRFDYWALGGSHQRRVMEDGATQGAVCCGSPQGRSLTEVGPHGFHLIDVDADGAARLHAVDTDLFRYCKVVMDASDLSRGDNLRQMISSRISRLLAENGERHLMIGWELHPASAEALVGVGDPSELITWLRRDFGNGNPSAWTVSLEIHPPQKYPKQWQEEDTILGDFLRAAERHRRNQGRDLNMLPMTEEHEGLSAVTASLLADADPSQRPRLLGDATLIGVELLRGGKPKL
jgi:DNA repair protein SbcD/Mre11